MEDVFRLLKDEDDNPRGQAGGNFRSGGSLEEAAAAEARKKEIKSQRWPIGRQEVRWRRRRVPSLRPLPADSGAYRGARRRAFSTSSHQKHCSRG